jgi:peptide/nickel transport system substrate-binding protein
MRSHPIGTGPFKFVEFQPNEHITVTRNPDYWKKDRPYLDGIEYTIIKDVSTRTYRRGCCRSSPARTTSISG